MGVFGVIFGVWIPSFQQGGCLRSTSVVTYEDDGSRGALPATWSAAASTATAQGGARHSESGDGSRGPMSSRRKGDDVAAAGCGAVGSYVRPKISRRRKLRRHTNAWPGHLRVIRPGSARVRRRSRNGLPPLRPSASSQLQSRRMLKTKLARRAGRRGLALGAPHGTLVGAARRGGGRTCGHHF